MELFRNTLVIGGAKPISINAATHRITSIGKLFKVFSENVSLLCIFEGKEAGNIFGLEYCTYKYPSNFFSWIKFVFSAKKYLKIIKNINNLDCVVVNQSIPSIPTIKIAKYCHKKGIKFVFDIGEWYEKSKWWSIKGFIKNIDTSIRMKKICFKYKNYLVSSKLLFNYIKRETNNVLILPTIVDEKIGYSIEDKNTFMKLCFCGMVEKGTNKENLSAIVRSVELFNLKHEEKIDFGIIGAEGISSEFIHFHGKKPYSYCISKLCSSDFVVIPRDHSRKNDSGFPTKLSEALVYGVPVIATDTGDISNYLIDGVNGFLLKENNEHEFSLVLERILDDYHENKDFFRMMKKNTSETNKLRLDCFKDVFSGFVKNIL